MKQDNCNFHLKPKTGAAGKVTVSSNSIAMGLFVCLISILAGGMTIALDPDDRLVPAGRQHATPPVQEVNSTVNMTWDEIDTNVDFGFDQSESTSSDTKGDAEGRSVRSQGIPSARHIFIGIWVLGACVGVRIMFTGTRIEIDTRHGRVRWRHTHFLGRRTATYASSQVNVFLHETVLRSTHQLDWHGFAASLVNTDTDAIQLARSNTIKSVTRYASDFKKLAGIDVGEIGVAEATSRGLYMHRPFSLRRYGRRALL